MRSARVLGPAPVVLFSVALLSVLLCSSTVVLTAQSVIVFDEDFESGTAPAEISGVGSIQGTQGYGPLGSGTWFLRTSTLDDPTEIVLSLTGLPPHVSVDVSFLLAAIDSWDGEGVIDPGVPDFFTVSVDGAIIFEESLENSEGGFWPGGTPPFQSYDPPPGVELARRLDLGFTGGVYSLDSAYDMGLDPVLDGIPHTADTLTIVWLASGAGWQPDPYPLDETFAWITSLSHSTAQSLSAATATWTVYWTSQTPFSF